MVAMSLTVTLRTGVTGWKFITATLLGAMFSLPAGAAVDRMTG